MGWRDKGSKLFKRKKKKPKKFVTLFLEKDGKTKELTLKIGSNWSLAKKVKPLFKYAKQRWTIIKVEGNDPGNVEFFRKIAEGYRPNARELYTFAGLPGLPKKMKKFFGKDGELKNNEMDD